MIIQFAHDWIECAASKLSVQSPLAWNDVIRAGNPRLRHLCYHHVTDKGTDAQTLDALAIGGATSISPLHLGRFFSLSSDNLPHRQQHPSRYVPLVLLLSLFYSLSASLRK